MTPAQLQQNIIKELSKKGYDINQILEILNVVEKQYAKYNREFD